MAYGTFHSVLTANLPASGIPGDVWYTTDTRLLYAVVGDGSLVQLLVAVPIPVIGPPGPAGPPGPVGPAFFATITYMGNWAFEIEYAPGMIVTYNGFLYMSNISNFANPPSSSPFWNVLGPIGSSQASEIAVVVDGAGQIPVPGLKGYFQIPFACVVTGWTLFADQPGDAAFDVKWTNFSSFPTTNSIVGSNNPALVAQQKNEVSDVSALWSPTSFNAGDILEFDLLSVATVTLLTLTINLTAS